MDSGVSTFPTHDAMPPGSLARLVEAHGHKSLYYSEHTHIPSSRATPFPGGEPLPAKYWHNYDLFIALTAAAAATSSLRIGSGICLAAQRDPIILAKEVASLDHLSGGRFEFGIGAGWNVEEMRNHGLDASRRFAVLAENVRAMKEIWTQDEASFEGRHVRFERIWSWPKPAQRPHPPVLIGGVGPTVLDRVLAYCDGWMPFPFDGLLEQIATLRARAADAGRATPLVIVSGVPNDDPKALETLANAGVDRLVFEVPAARQSPVERTLETIANVMSEAFGT